MKITLNPSYATNNTVRFDEAAGEATSQDFLGRELKSEKGAMGAPINQYFTPEQLSILGWKPTAVGAQYETEPDRRGKTYVRTPVTGPSIVLTLTVAK